MIINPDCDMQRWEVDSSVMLVDPSNYYTKAQTDDLIEGVSGMTPQDVQDDIDVSISAYSLTVEEELANKLDVSAYTPTDLSQYYTSAETEEAIAEAVSGKQDTLIAGTNITITNNVISASGGGGGGITSGEVQSMIDSSISGKQDTLSAGTNITIVDNVISAEAASITVDQTIIEGSTNAVAGGAVYAAIGNIETLLSQI